jgi:hypothetical protein
MAYMSYRQLNRVVDQIPNDYTDEELEAEDTDQKDYLSEEVKNGVEDQSSSKNEERNEEDDIQEL